jgi:cell division transport system ATP-binding protein
MLVTCQNLSFAYGLARDIFAGVSLSLRKGEFYYLTGASGVGKTTLLRLLYGGLRQYRGSLSLLGKEARRASERDWVRLRQQMGVVFQDFKLLPYLTALENVALPLIYNGIDAPQALQKAQDLLEWVGLGSFCETVPDKLSGGQQQRVALARAVITAPPLILADEPTGNIDDDNATRILHLLEQLHQVGSTIVFATHNRSLVQIYPHPELFIHEGQIQLYTPDTRFSYG